MQLPLLADLQRRRVFRALVGYAIVAFAVLQVIEPLMHGLRWPDSVISYVVAALAVGFPLVVGLAWIFDVKAAGTVLPEPMRSRRLRVELLLASVAALVAAGGLVWYMVARPLASLVSVIRPRAHGRVRGAGGDRPLGRSGTEDQAPNRGDAQCERPSHGEPGGLQSLSGRPPRLKPGESGRMAACGRSVRGRDRTRSRLRTRVGRVGACTQECIVARGNLDRVGPGGHTRAVGGREGGRACPRRRRRLRGAGDIAG